jgi:hypothetical protein
MLTRRDLLERAGRFGAGAIAAFRSSGIGFAADGHFGGVTPTAPKGDNRFPLPPTWETELKEVAPNVYAYIQAGGPDRDNASVANGGTSSRRIITAITSTAAVLRRRDNHRPPLLPRRGREASRFSTSRRGARTPIRASGSRRAMRSNVWTS